MEAVNYLLSTYPEWRNHYNVHLNRWFSMSFTATDLSKFCGLDIFADCFWIGAGDLGLGLVFTGANSIREPLKSTRNSRCWRTGWWN